MVKYHGLLNNCHKEDNGEYNFNKWIISIELKTVIMCPFEISYYWKIHSPNQYICMQLYSWKWSMHASSFLLYVNVMHARNQFISTNFHTFDITQLKFSFIPDCMKVKKSFYFTGNSPASQLRSRFSQSIWTPELRGKFSKSDQSSLLVSSWFNRLFFILVNITGQLDNGSQLALTS